jgi:hypothetical protein
MACSGTALGLIIQGTGVNVFPQKAKLQHTASELMKDTAYHHHQWLYNPCKDLGRLTPEVSYSY